MTLPAPLSALLPAALTAALFALLGFALGLAHFRGLRRDVSTYLSGGLRVSAVAAHAARVLVTVGAIVLVARTGGAGLLAVLAGFLVARHVVVAGVRRAT
jgi:hypothetical protein